MTFAGKLPQRSEAFARRGTGLIACGHHGGHGPL